MPPRRTQAERSAGTTAELVAHATELFGRDGYDQVSLVDVAEAAGVTKGAVYHHFGGKRELFLAVFTAAHEQLAERVAAAAGGSSGVARLRAGAVEFLVAVAEPGLQRIVVLDGPRVLDRPTIRAVEDAHAAGRLRAAFTRLQDDGRLQPGDPGLRTRLIIGALCEAATAVADAPDPAEALVAARVEVTRLLDGVLRGSR